MVRKRNGSGEEVLVPSCEAVFGVGVLEELSV